MQYCRRDGKLNKGNAVQDRVLSFIYSHALCRLLIRPLIIPKVSEIMGHFMDSRLSAFLVKPTVKLHSIDLSQYRNSSYNSYNDFFTRQIRPELRPISEDKSVFISPCDAKLTVYPIDYDGTVSIKNTEYTFMSLFRDRRLMDEFRGGSLLVFRLTVDDYHRYCYVDSGTKTGNRIIKGVLHTVNPAANDAVPIYKENTREYSMLHSDDFGKILMMEVGAMMVGRIVNYHGRGHVKRGQEKGRFEFGGSTVVLCVQRNKVRLDKDIIENTSNGIETIVKMGERIGKAESAF